MAKENKLEKNIGNKEKVAKALANYVAPFIPFTFFSKKLKKYWQDIEKSPGTSRELGNGIISILFSAGVLLYSMYSIKLENIDFTKWSKIKEQKQHQEKIQQQKNSYETFKKYDTNFSNTLDSVEFLNYYRKKK